MHGLLQCSVNSLHHAACCFCLIVLSVSAVFCVLLVFALLYYLKVNFPRIAPSSPLNKYLLTGYVSNDSKMVTPLLSHLPGEGGAEQVLGPLLIGSPLGLQSLCPGEELPVPGKMFQEAVGEK